MERQTEQPSMAKGCSVGLSATCGAERAHLRAKPKGTTMAEKFSFKTRETGAAKHAAWTRDERRFSDYASCEKAAKAAIKDQPLDFRVMRHG